MKRFVAIALCLMLCASLVTSFPTASAASSSLPFTVSYGTSDNATLPDTLTVVKDDGVNDALVGGCVGLTVDSVSGIPCQVFDVDVSGTTADSITLTAQAATIENERLALKVYNVTSSAWNTVATAITSGELTADVDLTTYAKDGKVQAMITPDYVTNGSNRLLWSTDQQHYTEWKDLNHIYTDIHNYMVSEYQAGNLAYVINTGDIVDDPPTYTATAPGQWKLADKAFAILDDAGVPYGIVAGNHDVGDYPLNRYEHYDRYFNEDRYADKAWFGGTADNNRCHYDLVTVGNVDLLVMYFGFGVEAEVLDWANDVLAMYPHRSAILCTHQYLSPLTLDHKGRADILHDSVVTQNENVVMVLSGHYSGAACVEREVGEDRIVVEIVHDYQTVQAEPDSYYAGTKDPTHTLGSVLHCNGEGYLRELVIEGNTVSNYAFSPVTGGTVPYGIRDDFSVDVPFLETYRTITVRQFAASDSGKVAADQTSPYEATYNADTAALNTLIEDAKDLKKNDYTKESYAVFKAALKTAKGAVKNGSDIEIQEAFTALSIAKGALVPYEETMDRDKLTTVIDLDMDIGAWENDVSAKQLDAGRSHVTVEVNDNGGFTVEKSMYSTSDWPYIKYSAPIIFTPEDGKVYLYLDIDANSTWSCFPTIIQGNTMAECRMNYAIEGSYSPACDAGGGSLKGVYDVTQALIDSGIDPTKEMTISFGMNIVPGPITINEISILTGEYPQGIDPLWIVLAAVVLLAVGAVVFAVMYNPKKDNNEATAVAVIGETPATDEASDDTTKTE